MECNKIKMLDSGKAVQENPSSELQESRREVKRLVKNWRALLDIMPDMVFLIREDYIIEYMNTNAIMSFGDLREKICFEGLHHAKSPCIGACPVKMVKREDSRGSAESLEMEIGDKIVEYNFVPFHGYKGDCLILVNMRDITQRKSQEQEIAAFNHNIEDILLCKIEELNESEKTRNHLADQVGALMNQLKVLEYSDEMVGSSKALRKIKDMVSQVAMSDATILITGESGTGKELAANLIRKCSNRHSKPFLKVNCNSINDNLLESDLFGYEKGAFTGAVARKKGKFEIVDGGTIFLDEIGDISPKMQSSLLRILQNGEIIRVGGTEAIHVDVRIIAATNIDLAKAVKEGNFRLDLYYRLNIINITTPSLRERKDDILDLATHFVRHYRKAFKKEIDFMPNSVIDKLLSHDWPGNVRELENVIQRAVLMAQNNTITERDIHFDQGMGGAVQGGIFGPFEERVSREPLKTLLGDIECTIIKNTLDKYEGNVQEAAKILKVGKTALYDKMKRHGLSGKPGKN
ncbi:MAG: sigma-54-dependent Fis family transcriptional regulator [Proteobacteria bacterium]|nr:sigma-54-dependent Fis family transcriptional regulator [Pseudomonadota bacterium]MBU1709031.1 sigma-54-dependent Fis family transcriptional regulator [Pseudomonadota bacterium]